MASVFTADYRLPLLAIDPGRNVGYALTIGGTLVDFGTIVGVAWNQPIDDVIDRLPAACIAVIEMPRVYPSVAKWKGDPQHIVRLAYLAGRIGEHYPYCREVEPKTWQRGSPPERILRQRTRTQLTPSELQLVDSKPCSAHAWDAIGIIVYSLNRPI